MRLQDKVIIITGSTNGIGQAIAERCVAEGARVLVHGRDRAHGEAVVARLGDRAALHLDNLADPAAAGRIVDATRQAFGRIDAVVNNAATVVHSTVASTTAGFFDAVMAVNVRAPLLLIQAALPELKRNRGCVLNIGSINALSGEPTMLDYSVSKGALQTLSRNLANALAPERVRVNHFNVGWVLTPNEYALQRKLGQPEDWPQRVPPAFAPSGRLIQPGEIAAAAVFWLSDESGPISGSVVELEQFSLIGRNPAKT
ncbi:MAG: SDR family oxidoreductase [Opitutae bacterium]|nr:SDR family oxidoreductase [Opitutae bacterium]